MWTRSAASSVGLNSEYHPPVSNLTIINARVLTLAGADGPRRGAALGELGEIERGFVRIQADRIEAVGPGEPGGTGEVVDAQGCVEPRRPRTLPGNASAGEPCRREARFHRRECRHVEAGNGEQTRPVERLESVVGGADPRRHRVEGE